MSAAVDTPFPVPSEHAPECPRCGYDQQGTVSSWYSDPSADNAACPLTGTCSECGLTFEWPDLLVPERTQCPGLFEHVRGTQARFRAWWRTALWMIFPGIFWSRVKMHHVVRPGRLAMPLIIGTVVFLAERVLMALCVGTGLVSSGPRSPAAPGPLDDLNWYGLNEWHFAAVFPYFEQSGWGMQATRFGCLLAAMLASALIWPMLLLVLPQTRARAKLRLAHVQRAFLYSLWPLIALFGLTCVGFVIDALVFSGLFSMALPLRDLAIILIVPAIIGGVLYLPWLAAWWSVALTTGWKVHGGWGLALLLSFTSLLAAGVAAISLHMYL